MKIDKPGKSSNIYKSVNAFLKSRKIKVLNFSIINKYELNKMNAFPTCNTTYFIKLKLTFSCDFS